MIPAAGRHGGDGARVAAALGIDPGSILDLSLSVNPFAPDVAAMAGAHLDNLRRYPDVTDAETAMACALGIDPARVVLTNGGAEAIALLTAVVGGGVVAEPEFGLHPRADDGPRWRSNPHNPTGRLAPTDATAEVWDEAFYPLATGAWTRGDPAAWVVGSLTKVFACPGLRVGYALAPDPEAAFPARARRPEWAVNGLACALVPELLAGADLHGWSRAIADARAALVAMLSSHGLVTCPSDAPWVLVGGAGGLRDALAQRGVVVRDCTSFGLADHVRIAVPDADGLRRLEEALCAAR